MADAARPEPAGKRDRFVYEEDVLIEKPFNWTQFRRLARYLLPYRRRLSTVALAAVLLGTAAKLAAPLLVRYAVDEAVVPGRPDLLAVFGAALLSLFVVQWVVNRFRIRAVSEIGQQVMMDLRSDLFRHVQNLSFRFFDKRPAGSVLVRITNDVNALQDLVTNGVVNLLVDCLQLAGIVVLLLTLHFKLGLAVTVTVPLLFVVSSSLRRRTRRAWQVVRIHQSRLNAHLAESIQGIRVTQAFTQERENEAFFDRMNTANRRAWDKASALNQSFGPLIELTAAVGTCVLFGYGAYLVRTDPAMTVGLLVAFANYIGNFWEPIHRLGQMYSQLLIAMASSERIFECLDERPSVTEKQDAVALPPIRGDVRFENVEFRYEQDRPALRGVDLDVEAGQAVAIVGRTGSGKTTLVQLLCRFYDPTAGRITVDGFDLRDVTIRSLRSQIAMVLQEPFIFSGTIRDNIRYGRLDATDEEVEAAARAVFAHDFIARLPDGYRTEVEERGSALSAGQRQLIAFARALLADPRILILDEATASIDTETEKNIQLAMRTLLKGRTSFIIAHRLSTVRDADRIVVLDDGRIVETGTHEELLRRRGTYARLVEAQYALFDRNPVIPGR